MSALTVDSDSEEQETTEITGQVEEQPRRRKTEMTSN